MKWLSDIELAVVRQAVSLGHAITPEVAKRILGELDHYREAGEERLNYKIKSDIKRTALVAKPKDTEKEE